MQPSTNEGLQGRQGYLSFYLHLSQYQSPLIRLIERSSLSGKEDDELQRADYEKGCKQRSAQWYACQLLREGAAGGTISTIHNTRNTIVGCQHGFDSLLLKIPSRHGFYASG